MPKFYIKIHYTKERYLILKNHICHASNKADIYRGISNI